MTYTGVGFSLKSGFKKIVLSQALVLVLNRVSRKYCLHQFFLYFSSSAAFMSQQSKRQYKLSCYTGLGHSKSLRILNLMVQKLQ